MDRLDRNGFDGLLDWIDWFVEGKDWIELGRLDWIDWMGCIRETRGSLIESAGKHPEIVCI